MKSIYKCSMLFTIIVSTLMGQGTTDNQFSLYSDVKAHSIGDIVTILIVESANASRESKVNSSGSASLGADGSVSGTLSEFLPVFGMSSSLSSKRDGEEGTEQKDKLTGKISARIVERTDSGMLLIKGERIVEVSGEANVMQVEGYVRSRDIGNDNTVYSYNMAEAKIIYRKDGLKNKIIKPGTMHRIGTWILGAALLTVAVTGALIV